MKKPLAVLGVVILLGVGAYFIYYQFFTPRIAFTNVASANVTFSFANLTKDSVVVFFAEDGSSWFPEPSGHIGSGTATVSFSRGIPSGRYRLGAIDKRTGKTIVKGVPVDGFAWELGKPSATIDQNSLLSNTNNPILTGTVRNHLDDDVDVLIENRNRVIIVAEHARVVELMSDGAARWELALQNIPNGTYTVKVLRDSYNPDPGNVQTLDDLEALTIATLIVQAN